MDVDVDEVLNYQSQSFLVCVKLKLCDDLEVLNNLNVKYRLYRFVVECGKVRKIKELIQKREY
jgi:hypothetical protein